MERFEIALFPTDFKRTVAFYQAVTGVRAKLLDPAEAELYLGPLTIRIIKQYDRQYDHVGFAVRDVDAACRKLRKRGIKPRTGPKDFPWGRSAYFRDPKGRWVELYSSHPRS